VSFHLVVAVPRAVPAHALAAHGLLLTFRPWQLFVGGIPSILQEGQVRELVGAFGAIKSLQLTPGPNNSSVRGLRNGAMFHST